MALPVPKFRHHLVHQCQPLSALLCNILLFFIAEFCLSHLDDADADGTNNKPQLALVSFSFIRIKLIQSSRPPYKIGPIFSLFYESRTVSHLY